MGVPYSKEIDQVVKVIDQVVPVVNQVVPVIYQIVPVIDKVAKEVDHVGNVIDQVVPIIDQVLYTTKNVAVVLLWLGILVALVVALNLVCLVAILITLNPDLEEERRALVTPVVRSIARRTKTVVDVFRWLMAAALFLALALVLCVM